mmetsp:Transcript_20819/g.37085  ORF Transcript_20819/g.37085 Transcript_20819/m.37085 type:complete len:272 (+) Transcript_20819:225-1040(+)
MPRNIIIHISKQLRDRRQPLIHGSVKALERMFPELLLHFRLPVRIPHSQTFEIFSRSRNWIIIDVPILHLFERPVCCGVVGSGVVAASVRHRFDEHRTLVLDRQPPRFSYCLVYCQKVVSVHADTVHSVAWGAAHDAVSNILFARRSADRIPVVPAEEKSRRFESRCEIQRRMKVSLGSRSVSEIRHGDIRLPLSLQRIRGARRVRNLRCERRGNRMHIGFSGSVVDRHLPSFSEVVDVAIALVRHLLQIEPPPQIHARLSVLGVHNVLHV